MSELLLLLSTFGVVFFLGFQSLCVNSGYYWLTVMNSTLIGVFNLVLFKTAPNVASNMEVFCYIIGGPLGIVSAMWVHCNVVAPWMARRAAGKVAPDLADIIKLTVR